MNEIAALNEKVAQQACRLQEYDVEHRNIVSELMSCRERLKGEEQLRLENIALKAQIEAYQFCIETWKRNQKDTKRRPAEISELVGKVFSKVYMPDHKEHIAFELENGQKYIFYHSQDCCESVSVEDISGSLSMLEGVEILKAEESTDTKQNYNGHQTWTFYQFATKKGYVDIRWLGECHESYSTSVDLLFCES